MLTKHALGDGRKRQKYLAVATLLVILGGLAILGSEFLWARTVLKRAKEVIAKPRIGRERSRRGPVEPKPGLQEQ